MSTFHILAIERTFYGKPCTKKGSITMTSGWMEKQVDTHSTKALSPLAHPFSTPAAPFLATTRCNWQPLVHKLIATTVVANCNKWLLNATSVCEKRAVAKGKCKKAVVMGSEHHRVEDTPPHRQLWNTTFCWTLFFA